MEEASVDQIGSCQFPTLGFVVDRYFRVKNFVPEPFWSIKMMHNKAGKKANFNWQRNRLFDRMSTVILYERCLASKTATVTKVQEKPTRKFKPLPLTTVELQKAATRLLRMTGQQAMTIAEGLYNKGFISYPRTETDRFDRGINLRALVQKQTPGPRWGQYAQALTDGGFQQPREGRHDDRAHPPIHPITYADPSVLNADEARLYEYIVRRFLACCSEDAKGMATDIDIKYGDEIFSAHGVIVLERNYLEVYIYENWNNTAELPSFTMGEQFTPTEAMMTEGKTSPPGYLTEADLIALMDANGIGTDATMAEHIQKIQDREYAATIQRSGQTSADSEEPDNAPPARGGRGRGGRGARGGRGRGGASSAGNPRGGVKVFVPTQLGVALILGFDRMNFETSLGKPFLRREMELKMKAICEGRTTKAVVLRESIAQYRHVFVQTQEKLDVLRAVGLPEGAGIKKLRKLTGTIGLSRVCLCATWRLKTNRIVRLSGFLNPWSWPQPQTQSKLNIVDIAGLNCRIWTSGIPLEPYLHAPDAARERPFKARRAISRLCANGPQHTFDPDDVIEHGDDLTRNMAAAIVTQTPLALAVGSTGSGVAFGRQHRPLAMDESSAQGDEKMALCEARRSLSRGNGLAPPPHDEPERDRPESVEARPATDPPQVAITVSMSAAAAGQRE